MTFVSTDGTGIGRVWAYAAVATTAINSAAIKARVRRQSEIKKDYQSRNQKSWAVRTWWRHGPFSQSKRGCSDRSTEPGGPVIASAGSAEVSAAAAAIAARGYVVERSGRSGVDVGRGVHGAGLKAVHAAD